MKTINYTEIDVIESYSAVFNSLSFPSKIELMERLLKSLKTEQEETALQANEFIPEKTAEQIITELRESRNSGKTRVIESF